VRSWWEAFEGVAEAVGGAVERGGCVVELADAAAGCGGGEVALAEPGGGGGEGFDGAGEAAGDDQAEQPGAGDDGGGERGHEEPGLVGVVGGGAGGLRRPDHGDDDLFVEHRCGHGQLAAVASVGDGPAGGLGHERAAVVGSGPVHAVAGEVVDRGGDAVGWVGQLDGVGGGLEALGDGGDGALGFPFEPQDVLVPVEAADADGQGDGERHDRDERHRDHGDGDAAPHGAS